MISLILPYWDRQSAADKALVSLDACYRKAGIEIIVVDDGNQVPFRLPDIGLPVHILRLPLKQKPSSPIVALNRGAAVATGEIMVLSCIEVIHQQPVLLEMAEKLETLGPFGYVMAAAWCPEQGEWHCSSQSHSRGGPQPPKGFGRPFCAAMYRGLFWTVGGFNEEYAEGAGYEDLDFLKTLEAVGALPVFCEDLVVTHPKTEATIRWPAESFARNKAIYERRWPC